MRNVATLSAVECVVVLEVDLVLTAGDLVVAGFDLEAHLLESVDDIPSDVACEVRGDVEVAAVVGGFGRRVAVLVLFEHEELGFGCEVDLVAHLLGALDGVFQDATRVALEQFARGGIVNVTDHPTGGAIVFLSPGQNRERLRVGNQTHVRFLDADEALDGGAVEVDALGERLLGLACGDGDVLDRSQDIGKL